MSEVQLSVLHVKEVEALLNLLTKHKDDLPEELVEQLLLIETLEG